MEAALKTVAGIEAQHKSGGGLTLFIIDPQTDFHPGGSLAIPTANEDAIRTAAFIRSHLAEINQLIITLDSHQRLHIAHGIFWTNNDGASPPPFTVIPSSDVASGKWKPRSKELRAYALEYTKALEAGGRFQLCIWPEHCIIGTKGQTIVDPIHEAALEWTKLSRRPIYYVQKGSNCFTEHYSALKADVVLPHDPATSLNQEVVNALKSSKIVAVCGQALSHCVNFTVRDLVNLWPENRVSDIVVMTDCTSSVPGFESSGEVWYSVAVCL
jgi:nicotinamidase/pyrazinamidase